MTMHRIITLATLLPLLMIATPVLALTTAEKAETCKFGADDQKLTGAKRKTFIERCMVNRNDRRGPATAVKKSAAPKTTTSPAPAAAPPSPPSDGKM
jgi:hypothetical protein